MLQPDPERIDFDEFRTRDDSGYKYTIEALGVTDWPTDAWVLKDDGNGEVVVVPVTPCTPWTIVGTLDTNVSPAKLSVSAKLEGDQSWIPPATDSGISGVTSIVEVVRLALDGDEAVSMLRTELEV